jgi:error-prone DNA polymerase
MNTLPRLKPRCFYDLVVEVALIRPGPIQGEMVHPYLRRKAGEEEVTYPHPSLEPILKRTLGVPLFQEQGMQVAIAAAGFTAGEADNLRRAMGHKRSRERMADICQKMIDGMLRNGFSQDVAQRIYNQINAFADYGFPESHAASFALLVYASAYLKHYYAPEFTAAILNAQPMGFYSPGTLIEDAKRHGVVVLPVDASRSRYDSTLEPVGGEIAVRLGLRLVRGIGGKARDMLQRAVEQGGPFASIGDVIERSGLERRALRALAEAGALDCFVPDEPSARRRRAAVWRMLEVERGDAGPLAPSRIKLEVPTPVRAMSPREITAADYRMTGLSLNGHPMLHLRAMMKQNGVRTAREIMALPDGTRNVAAAGLVICRQRPGTAKGFVFLTLEDETGLVNVVVLPKKFEKQALMISTAPLILVRGTLQVEQTVVNLRGDVFRELKAGEELEGWKGHDFH